VRITLHHSSMPYKKAATEMTKEMVEEAQKAWGDGIVKIATAYPNGEYVQEATDHINNLYAYEQSKVLFKPTLAADEQFRGTFDKALSYFVATDKDGDKTKKACSEDGGFAIKGWTAVRFENTEEIITIGGVGMAMGNYFFTDAEGKETKVEYSFGYMLDEDGNVRITLHHSSMPYKKAATEMTKEMVEEAQKAWGDGIVKIATAYPNGEYVQEATDHINNLYAYEQSKVLFKPTLAADEQFRGTFDKALSYFVATDKDGDKTKKACSEDGGFAIKGWTAVRFENTEEIITSGGVGMAMGNYFFTNADGETKVEYSFGYMLDEDGTVRIILHHSSMPYEAAPAAETTASP